MTTYSKYIIATILYFIILGRNTEAVVLEPFMYHQNFESLELSGWASYPLWQDTAYDPNFQAGTIIPGESNISIIQKVTTFSNVDIYAGSQKKFDAYLIPGSSVKLRYFLKSHLDAEYIKIRLAAGEDGKVDFTISNPEINRWQWITVKFNDFIIGNANLSGKKKIKVNALAVCAKFPKADPVMPVYLGIDDVTVKGAQLARFKFAEPVMHKLTEWKPSIPDKHYHTGDVLAIRGSWIPEADKVTLTVSPCIDHSQTVYSGNLGKRNDEWFSEIKLSFPEGLYYAVLRSYNNEELLSLTEFTFFIVPKNIGKDHPRVWFNSEEQKRIGERLKSERFRPVYEEIVKNAATSREEMPVDSVVFDIDQFPDENWLPTLGRWSWERIHKVKDAFFSNALEYTFDNNIEAGLYAKELMLKTSTFPYLIHPWMKKRNRHIYYQVAEFGMSMAVAYDLLYHLMDEHERHAIRDCMKRNVVQGCHKGYVVNNLVITNISNWIAHITSGSLLCQAAMYDDGPDVAQSEPYLTGAILKNYEFIKNSTGDDAFGEGYVYFNYSMLSWAKSLPALERVFKIDLSEKFSGSYKEFIWAANVKEKKQYYFGDSRNSMESSTKAFGSCNDWAWLLAKNKDPLLGWFYDFLKDGNTFMDVLYETGDVPKNDPFQENPVKVFKNVGTTVFKSGWEPDDFVFVLRTGPFQNHQHLDQGTFWLSDRGSTFIGERHGSSYYADPLYQSRYTQPIGHSTILINNNPQSQRVGDTRTLADGFDDFAFIYHFLDGTSASFTSGDIGRLYWGKVKEMRRNVLYLKPRTLLMLDTVIPAEQDVDVTLLYQAPYLKNILPDNNLSKIVLERESHTQEIFALPGSDNNRTTTASKGKNTLFIRHLYPEGSVVKSVETPHFIATLKNQKPLEREGMLTLTARTEGRPLIIANLLSTASDGTKGPDVIMEKGDGYTSGKTNGVNFAFTTRPNRVYRTESLRTDALAVSWNESTVFAALCTILERDGHVLFESVEPVTFEADSTGYRFYCSKKSSATVGVRSKPARIMLNHTILHDYVYHSGKNTITVKLPAGEGKLVILY